MSGPQSLAPWVNLTIIGDIEERLADFRRAPAVPFDEMTRRLYAEAVAFCASIGKPPPPAWTPRTTVRWCEMYGIYTPRWDKGNGR